MKNCFKDSDGLKVIFSIVCLAFGLLIFFILITDFYYHLAWLNLTWNLFQENLLWWIICAILLILGRIFIK